MDRLDTSILTSSSTWSLDRLLEAIGEDICSHAELYLFRDVDIYERWQSWDKVREVGCIAKYVAELTQEDISEIARKVGNICLKPGRKPYQICSCATYFPEVSSCNADKRKIAELALINAARLASALGAKCVEIVAGLRLDPSNVGENESGVVQDTPGNVPSTSPPSHISCEKIRAKQTLFLRTLIPVLRCCACENLDVSYAVEMETDPYHVVRNAASANALFEIVDGWSDGKEKELLQKRLGLNLDISHAMINGDDAEQFRDLCPRIVHAHVSDNPGAHVQDQVIGAFHPLLRSSFARFAFIDYIKMLHDAMHNNGLHPHFTGCISIELESCDWIQWVRTSLRRLRFLIRHAAEMGAPENPPVPASS